MPESEQNIQEKLHRLKEEDLESRVKVDLLNDISSELRLSDPDKSLHYSAKAKELARISGYKEGLAYGFLYEGISRIRLGDYDTSFHNLKKALEIFEDTGDLKGMGSSLVYLGNLSQLNSDHTEALKYYQRCVRLKKETGDLEGEACLVNNTGFAFKVLKDYKSALDNYLKALDIYISLNDLSGQAITLSNLGALYMELNEYDTSVDYYEQVLSIKDKLRDKQGQIDTLVSIAEVCAQKSDYEDALGCLYKALELCWDTEDKKEASSLIQLIADTYIRCGDLGGALKHMNESLRLKREIGDKRGEVLTLLNIGSLYVLNEDFDIAEVTLDSVFMEINNYGLTEMLPVLFKTRSVFYEFKKDFKNALLYFRKYKESLENESMSDNVGVVKENFNNYFDFKYLRSIDSGDIELKEEKVDISELALAVAESYRNGGHGSGGNRVVFKSVPESNIVLADSKVMYKVIDNLVSFAVKSLEKDKAVFVYLSGRGGKVRCEVMDEGSAIDKEKVKRLTEAGTGSVYEAVEGAEDNFAGLLAAKILTEKMKGTFGYESFLSSGNAFILEFNEAKE